MSAVGVGTRKVFGISVGDVQPNEPPYRRLSLPPYVIYCITIVFLAVVAAFVILAVTESDTTEFRAWFNSVLNFAGLLLGVGGVAFAASADRKAGKAAEQTNGNLDARIRKAVEQSNIIQTALEKTVREEESDG